MPPDCSNFEDEETTALCTAWCSEIGSLTSLDAPELHAFSDVREPISLHQAVHQTSMMYRVHLDSCANQGETPGIGESPQTSQ